MCYVDLLPWHTLYVKDDGTTSKETDGEKNEEGEIRESSLW